MLGPLTNPAGANAQVIGVYRAMRRLEARVRLSQELAPEGKPARSNGP